MPDIADRLNAALEGRYRIEDEVGEGGMATVYLADDLRHERKVALKVLKPELAAVVGGDRFLAEIKTTANLQHPHILPLFDSGEADGFLFFVMPFIDGETLRERLDREKQLPVDEALGIATAVAAALQAAHDEGVVHRDIKPGNILLSRGEPLVADFGIALAVGAAGGNRLTETGLSVGTPYYMSPEQATGDQAVGAASDTYALACVLYEMLVGEPPYLGNTAQAVLGKIIQGQPVSATAARSSIPANVDAAIRRALEKIPADRFATARDFARALADPTFRYGEGAGTAAGLGSAGPWKGLAIGAALLAILGLGSTVYLATRPEGATPVIRYTITFPEEQVPVTSGQPQFGTSLTLSQDGHTMVYVGPAPGGSAQLWVKMRDQLEARPLSGTDEAHQPSLSPEGTHVAYITAGQERELKTASLGGEPPLTLLGEGIFRLGTAWGDDGYVYFSEQPAGGLSRVPANGGDVERLSIPDSTAGETRHAWPDVLPNGKGVLMTVQRGNNALSPEDDVGVLDLDTGEWRVLFRGLLGRYAATGHLIFVTHEGDLLAAPFDQTSLEVTGPAVPVLSGMPAVDRGPDVALSRSGRLVYSPIVQSAVHEPVWVDRNGAATPVEQGWTLSPAGSSGPRLSPDDALIAVSIFVGGGDELWVKRIGGPFSRLAFEGVSSARPAWTPDGRSLMYARWLSGSDVTLMMQRADGSSADAEVVVQGFDRPITGGEWSADGEWVVFRTSTDPTRDIFGIRPGTDSDPVPLVTTDFEETSPQLSPDGRYLTYLSNESGITEIYVRPFPNVDDAKWQISTDGGREPLWAHDGEELFYKNVDRELVAVSVSIEDDFEVLGRDPLFTLPPGASYFGEVTAYDITSDDERFLMLRAAGATGEEALGHLFVVENFLEEIRERVGS